MSNADKHRDIFARLLLLCFVSLVMVTSCATPVKDVQVPVPIPENFSGIGNVPLNEKWWRALNDPRLNELIEQALAGNLSIQATWDRLEQARATARKSTADLFPGLEGSGEAARTITSMGGDRTYAGSFSLGLVAGYEVDLWGRIRSSRNAAELDALATAEDLHAAAITLSAEVADTWYGLIEQQGQLKLLEEQIKTNEEYLKIVTLRFRRGQVPATDVLQQRQVLESRKGKKIQVESEVNVLKHQLAILLGKAPGTLDISVGDALPELPPLPETGMPAEWIQRRPDIVSAYLRVQANDQRVAAAIAERFPKISLSASASTSSEQVRDLFDNWLASAAASVVTPLVDGGRRRAEVKRTKAAASESLNSYGQTVLDSLKEVEDALTRESHQQALLASLEKQLKLSRMAADQTRQRYAKGTEDFLPFLTALLNHQALQQTCLQARRELIQFRINLYRALSGSWELQRSDMKLAARDETPTGSSVERDAATSHHEGDSDNVNQ